MTAYRALALQTRLETVNALPDVVSARELMHRTLDRIGSEVGAAAAWIGKDLRLVVLPEYFLTGYAMGDPIEKWTEKAAVDADGPEYQRLGEIARAHNLFLAGNVFERDGHFPGLHFQCCFIVAPTGKVVLRYRRLNSMHTPTPHDVWDRYLDIYGYEGVFPVANTEIGVLAPIASEEILYPEIARAFAMRGAEVFFHPTSQANEHAIAAKDVCTVARAIENMAYVVSANTGGIHGTTIPCDSTNGGSKIVDPRGLVLCRSGFGETMTCSAEIDLNAIRRFRTRPGMDNLLARQRFNLFADGYRTRQHYPPNTMLTGIPPRAHFIETQRATIARLVESGILKAPD
jgi:predicted amidohydrolase